MKDYAPAGVIRSIKIIPFLLEHAIFKTNLCANGYYIFMMDKQVKYLKLRIEDFLNKLFAFILVFLNS